MKHWLMVVALIVPQAAQAMPNDPDVKGLAVAHAILPDAMIGVRGCLAMKLAETPDPVKKIPKKSWLDGRQVTPLAETGLAQQIVSANRQAKPIPNDIIDEAEMRAMFPEAHFDDGSAECRRRITLSLPRVERDWAFVEVGMHCGDLCGTGIIIAYRREHGRWLRRARALAWMS